MRVLCTFPGKHGDILWALPAMRALSRRLGQPVDLTIAPAYASLIPLLKQQPYLGDVFASEDWNVENTAPMTPRMPPWVPMDYNSDFHLGYRGWPQRPLPFETLDCLNEQSPFAGSKWTRFGTISDAELALDEPWITAPNPWYEPDEEPDVIVGFTDEYFELKYGEALLCAPHWAYVLYAAGSRWDQEAKFGEYLHHADVQWIDAANLMANAKVFFGCCSALHVLAVAMGKPCILMEPNPDRWNDIFYPLGKTGRVTLVMGNDWKPTFDARACKAAIEAALKVSV
jgi:hypothetical protein